MTGIPLLICGAGRVVERYYAAAFEKQEQFQVHGIVDTSEARRGWAASRFGARTYATLEEALAEDSFGAALVTTPPDSQAGLIKALLTAKLAVLTEKPGARSEAEAIELLEAAAGTPLRLGLARHFWRRYARPIESAVKAWSIEIETDPGAWGHLDISQSEGIDGLIYDLLPHAYDIATHVLGRDLTAIAEADWDGATMKIGFVEDGGAGASKGAICVSHRGSYLERVIYENGRTQVITSEKSLLTRIRDRLSRQEDEQVEAIGSLLQSFADDIAAGRTNDDLLGCARLIDAVRRLLGSGLSFAD